MKKLLVSLLAIAGLVACTNDEVVSVQKGNPIAFDTFVENVTRVGYNSGNLEGFDVWAFIESTNGRSTILTGEDVNRNDDGKWWYGNTQYWVPGNTYYFAALAPMNSQNVRNLQLATGDAAYKGLGTVEFTNVDGTEDLLYAATKVAANDQQGAVTFTFNHLLSKVKFSFTNTFDNENYSIKVRNIQMTAPETGAIDLTAGEYVWTDLAGETILNYGDTTATAAMGETVSPADERLTIPAGDTQKYIVTFDVELYVVGNLAKTYNKKSEIKGIALEAGKAYNFAANINAESLNLDEVVFDAEVDEWGTGNGAPQFEPYKVEVDGTNYDDFAVAVAKAMELNKPVKFFQHVVIDADTTITVPADKELTLELNGYTLTGVTDDADKNDDGTLASADNEVMFDVRGEMTVKDGTITTKHLDTNFGWNACTEIFYIGFGGTLYVENTTLENLGGSDMAYAIDMVNATDGITLNVDNSTIKSTYIPVRVFNNGGGMNYVDIKNSTLKGGSRAFWVHIYTKADDASFFNNRKDTNDNGYKDETLNINIYNPTCNNTFIANDPNRIIEYGFTNEINFDAFGNKLIADGIACNADETEYTVSAPAGLDWIADAVNGGNTFAGKTVKLVNDIDLEGVDFVSIGYNGGNRKYFEGTFDGNNKTIKNLKRFVRDDSRRSIGLFSQVNNATVKNLTLEDFTAAATRWEAAAIACEAVGDCTFENITLKNGSVVTYNNDTGGIVGWANKGNFTFKNITVGSDVTIHSIWGSPDTALGGIVGTLESPSTVTLENVTISCKLDAYNDVAANYQWYAYRLTGMIIGNMSETKTEDGRTTPDPEAAGVTCKNVTVNYGDWMNYHYCEFEANGVPSYADEGEWKFSRVEGSEWGRESNIDTDNCQHDTDESHNILLPVDQLFGGGQGVYGLREYAGVTVNYPASYRREVSSAAALTEALGKGVSVILDSDIDFGSTQLAITGENQVVDLNGKTLTTANNWGGISLKNGATIKNGTITHAGNTAAIKAFNGTSVENVTINATCSTADKTVTGIAVQQGAHVESIKNVTINGVSQGIEVGYQATVDLIENAVVNESNNGTAKGIGLVINGAKVGKAKGCTFKGETYGITMHLKGVFAVGLELENCTVEGTTASIYAWDEKGISNTSGSFNLKYDNATVFNGAEVYDFEDECKNVVTINGVTLQ